MAAEQPPLHRPRPRRAFDLAPPSADPSEPSSPAEPAIPDPLAQKDFLSSKNCGTDSVSRTGSIMNLTSSTLFGIYSPTAFDGMRDESSPWGTEAQTIRPPGKLEEEDSAARKRARSHPHLGHGLFRGVILPRVLANALLFGFGIVYGIITLHLHENHWITPVKLENADSYYRWQYLGFWGVAGVTLGNILPWLDQFYRDALAEKSGGPSSKDSKARSDSDDRTLSWNAAVRSVGAFVGIAFAMRRTPWQSTTQASLTLALANPVLWYLIDRTKTGFLLSSLVGLSGMSVFLGLKPDMVPSSTEAPPTFTIINSTGNEYALVTAPTQESVAVRTWVASVLFCACVCFGNIGRQLAVVDHRRGLSRQ